MYISSMKIKNYRVYQDLTIDFNEDINIIIGHNNAGKSNLIKAISIFFDSNTRKNLNIDDFNRKIPLKELKKEAPKISIELTIKESKDEEKYSDDLVTVSNWLVNLDEPYKAKLTYEYFLDPKLHDKYVESVKEQINQKDVWNILKHDFIRFYTYKIWGGRLENRIVADGESLKKFDFQFLDAVRDVERDMLTGRDTMLKKIFDFFIDYDIKSNQEMDDNEKLQEINKRIKEFSDESQGVLNNLKNRINPSKRKILSYSDSIGASFDNIKPNFDGGMIEEDFYSALNLIIENETNINLPISNNGLGYNNLIFMSLLLAKMQVDSDGKYLGSNAKVFPILAIEEPEAHLHPSMQFQFLEFLKENLDKKRVRQIFVTTHSTHITSSSELDQIICLYKNNDKIDVAYPGKVFADNDEDQKSKRYVQRFLDATKSDILFADRVILVEGMAEQLLLSTFAKYIDKSLEKNHIAVVDVGGRYFKHFLKLFDYKKSSKAINKKIACISDIDPVRKGLNGKDFKKCYPYESYLEPEKYKYKQNTILKNEYNADASNIGIFSQDETKGKTFEYDLILSNCNLKLLITDHMKNRKIINDLMDLVKNNESLEVIKNKLRDSKENNRIINSIDKSDWKEIDKKMAILASVYLNSIDKGEHALELAYKLEQNLKKKGQEEYKEFKVPKYIEDAIKWVCE